MSGKVVIGFALLVSTSVFYYYPLIPNRGLSISDPYQDLIARLCDESYQNAEQNSKYLIKDRCRYLTVSGPIVSNPNFITENSEDVYNEDIYQLEQLRKSVRLCLRSLQSHLHSENDWKVIYSNQGDFDELHHKIDQAIEYLERLSQSYVTLKSQELRLYTDDLLMRFSDQFNFKPGEDVFKTRKFQQFTFENYGYGTGVSKILKMFFLASARNATLSIGGFNNMFDIREYFDFPHVVENSTKRVYTSESKSPYSRKTYYPPHVPKTIVDEKIKYLTGNPSIWYMGVLDKFLFKKNPNFQADFNNRGEQIGLFPKSGPIACIHIRRGDKGANNQEVAQPTEKYLTVVEDFFRRCDLREQKPCQRKLFLATDDPKVITEVKTLVPNYQVLINENAADLAHTKKYFSSKNVKKMHNYKSSESVLNVLLDTYFMAEGDLFVGTQSSHVSEIPYHLRFLRDSNADETGMSLDLGWGHGDMLHPMKFRVLEENLTPGELKAKKGAVFKAAYYQVVKKKQICIDYILKEKHYPDPGLVYGWTSNKPKAKTHGFIPEFKLQFIQEFV